MSAGFEDAVTTLIYTGRPLRVRRNAYVEDWNENRRDEIKQLTSQGVLPHEVELKKRPEISAETRYVMLLSTSFMRCSYILL